MAALHYNFHRQTEVTDMRVFGICLRVHPQPLIDLGSAVARVTVGLPVVDVSWGAIVENTILSQYGD